MERSRLGVTIRLTTRNTPELIHPTDPLTAIRGWGRVPNSSSAQFPVLVFPRPKPCFKEDPEVLTGGRPPS